MKRDWYLTFILLSVAKIRAEPVVNGQLAIMYQSLVPMIGFQFELRTLLGQPVTFATEVVRGTVAATDAMVVSVGAGGVVVGVGVTGETVPATTGDEAQLLATIGLNQTTDGTQLCVVGPIFSGADGGSIAVEEPSCEIPPGSIVGGGSDASVGGNFALALAPTVVQDGTVSVFYSSSVRSVTGFEFTLQDASAIAIIGGADGPTAIFLASQLAPELLGAIAVAAYSYMALVPIIQPPIMKLFTTKEERKIEMKQLRHVSKKEKIIFPLMVLVLCVVFLPSASPLIGMFCLGNLMRECGVVDRLSNTAQNSLINIVTIFLGLSVGSKLVAEKFLALETLGILGLGAVAFAIGTACGVLMAKVLSKFSKNPINPLIGAAGVSAVPMAARVVNKVGLQANHHNFLLMHAMGPNVAGVIGSAVAAGVLLALAG